LGLELGHEFLIELLEELLVLALEDDLAGVAAMLEGIPGGGGLAGLGTRAGGIPGVQPVGVYLLKGSYKIGFVSSKKVLSFQLSVLSVGFGRVFRLDPGDFDLSDALPVEGFAQVDLQAEDSG